MFSSLRSIKDLSNFCEKIYHVRVAAKSFIYLSSFIYEKFENSSTGGRVLGKGGSDSTQSRLLAVPVFSCDHISDKRREKKKKSVLRKNAIQYCIQYFKNAIVP